MMHKVTWGRQSDDRSTQISCLFRRDGCGGRRWGTRACRFEGHFAKARREAEAWVECVLVQQFASIGRDDGGGCGCILCGERGGCAGCDGLLLSGLSQGSDG